MWTNGSERWPKNDGILHSYLVFQCMFSGCLSIRAKFNTCRLLYPSVRLRGSLSVLTAALFSPRLQVSFCWKSRGCWKRRRWQRRLRVSTAGSLMWSSARPTCSGECLIRSSFFFFFFIWWFPQPQHLHRDSWYICLLVAEMGGPQFSSAE